MKLYDVSKHFGEIINPDYDYSKVLMKKTTSSYLFKNKNLSGFLEYINNLLVNCIESVKFLRVYDNYNVEKDHKGIN